MYGMVNEGIHTFIKTNHGADVWQAICEDAGLDRTEFERMASYDDRITYKLVGSICRRTGLPAEDVLKIFGKYWVEFAGSSSFGSLLRLSGRNFVERVRGLDEMHDRILLSMPHLKPPSFELEDVDEHTYRLHYFSDREGLSPMVVGLLHGLAEETGEKITVMPVASRGEASDHDVFEIVLIE